MLQVLKRHPEYLRGVAVVTEDVTDQELQDMALAGVRGLRINVLFGGGIGFDAMENLASKIAPLGWHMQFLMDVRQLPALIPRMKKTALSVRHRPHGTYACVIGTQSPRLSDIVAYGQRIWMVGKIIRSLSYQ